MASKKDDEAKQAEQEAEKANLQNSFLSAVLVPKEFMEDEDLPISPAVQIDESADPLPPVRNKAKKVAPEPIKQAPKPKPPVDPSTLGAAESLMSGMVPSTSRPSQSEPSRKSEAPPIKTSSVEIKSKQHQDTAQSNSDPMASLLGGSKDEDVNKSTSPAVSPSAPSPAAPLQPNNEPEQQAASKPDLDEKLTEKESEKASTKKGGVFSKAKSLFSNITNKDKKE